MPSTEVTHAKASETHALTRDWRGARAQLFEVKAQAVAETLDHLNDLEEMVDQDGLEEISRDIRNLSSRLRSLRQDYEHGAAV